MSDYLPSLRNDIEVMPSPVADQPGLLIRDPYRFSGAVLIIPPVLVPALGFLDGTRTSAEMQAFLEGRIGQHVPEDIVSDLIQALDEHGFLLTEHFVAMRDGRMEEFRNAPERSAVHAGSGYPSEMSELQSLLTGYMKSSRPVARNRPTIGVAAPHVSPEGGWRTYASAFANLTPSLENRTFVILGTSHYGPPGLFGLTRKPFVTPLGRLEVNTALVDQLEAKAGSSVLMEDYCHSIEHSIEFQCLFLQHLVGTNARILPILCGSFYKSLAGGTSPESDDRIRQFFDALGEIAAVEGDKLFWILGIDLAHIGRRYGDDFGVQAGKGRMTEIRQKDQARLTQVCSGNSANFLEMTTSKSDEADELRWCGFSPLYTFLKTMPEARANVLDYEQWNIDEESVVSFTALEFYRKE